MADSSAEAAAALAALEATVGDREFVAELIGDFLDGLPVQLAASSSGGVGGGAWSASPTPESHEALRPRPLEPVPESSHPHPVGERNEAGSGGVLPGGLDPRRFRVRARRLLTFDVVPAVLERGALTDAAWPLLTQPSARALGGEDLGRSIPQPKVSDPELVLSQERLFHGRSWTVAVVSLALGEHSSFF